MNIVRQAVLIALLALASWATSARAEWIWIEAEKPVKQSMHRHPWYDSVKKDQFSGGDFISNFSTTQTGEATYEFTAPKAADYEFWVRTNPIQSSLSYRLNNADWTKIPTDRDPLDSINVAADGKPDLRFIAWIKVGKVALPQGKNTLEFRMDSKNSNHGMLDCFVFNTESFQPSGILKPDQIAQQNKNAAAQANGWLPFNPPDDPFTAAALDLRSLNEAFAGEHGFIAAKGSQFIFPGNNQPVRFWAVNGSGVESPAIDREALQKSARTLAKHGINLVRLHGGMFDETGNTDPKRIQTTIATIEEMKAQGIYTHLSIYFPLWLTPKPDNPVLKGYDGKTHPFAALYFNKDFQKQYQSWWTALLTTPSEKTGKRLLDDPAVASAEIINEDSYFFWTFSDKNIPDTQLRILESQFADWLKTKYGSLDKASAAWNGQRIPRDTPDENRIGFRDLWSITHQQTPRDQDTVAFLLHSQSTFYKDTVKFLRALGFKGLITASNWTTADARTLGPLERLSYTGGPAGAAGGSDFVDRHGYFGCLNAGDNSAWSIRDGHTYIDRSALRFDSESPGKPKQFSNPVADPSYNDLPSMISETTFNRPNRYRSEAPLFYAAYGALQGSDCIVHFAFDSSAWRVKPRFFMQPWTLMTPAMMGQFPAAALIFRKSLISPGDLMIDLNLRTDDLLHLKGSPLAPEASFDELRLKDVPQNAAALTAKSVIDPLVHFVGRTNINFTTEDRPSTLKDLRPFIDRDHQKITSSNGQLTLDYAKGLLTLNAPSAQGLSGALNATPGSAITLRDVAITSDMELGHIILVSLDDQPLATSSRMLLQVMSEEQATGFVTQDAGKGLKKIVSMGHDPWQIRELRGTVQLKRPDAPTLKVTPLDPNGYPARPLAPAAEIKLLPDTLYYLITK